MAMRFSASEMCVSWGGASVGGCSACLPFPHSSSATSYSHRLRGEESIDTSPAHTEPVVHSPRRTWPVPAHSVAICEGLEDWGAATDLSNLSDSDEEDQPAPLLLTDHNECYWLATPRLQVLPEPRRARLIYRSVASLNWVALMTDSLVAGRYRVMVESSMASTDDIIFNCGDVIQLLHAEVSGMWMVRNVSRGEEGRVLPEDLHRILGETC